MFMAGLFGWFSGSPLHEEPQQSRDKGPQKHYELSQHTLLHPGPRDVVVQKGARKSQFSHLAGVKQV